MLLRIEDTDRERNNPEAVAAIVDGLKWLELNWDGDTVSQFARAHRHRQVAEEMLASGHAYKLLADAGRSSMPCARRRRRRSSRSPSARRGASVIPPKRRPACRTSSASRPRARARPSSRIRCRAASCSQNKELDDLIILRSDGNPTYNLAVVVDDHDMQVTHIIRGVDHLTNAARQTQIYQAHGLGRADLRARAAHSRARRRQAIEASRGARHRGLQGDGLPAGGLAQLPGAPRLEPRQRRDHVDLADARLVRHSSTSTARPRASTSPSSRI